MPSSISKSVRRESPHRVTLPEPDTARGIHQLSKMDRAAADEPTDFANSANNSHSAERRKAQAPVSTHQAGYSRFSYASCRDRHDQDQREGA